MHLLKARVNKAGGEDSFKDKSNATFQCRKITQRLKLCNKLHKSNQQSEAREAAKPALEELKHISA